MTLIYYDEQQPKKELYIQCEKIREILGSDILFLPKSFSVYLNAPTEQLIAVKNAIDAALKLRETE